MADRNNHAIWHSTTFTLEMHFRYRMWSRLTGPPFVDCQHMSCLNVYNFVLICLITLNVIHFMKCFYCVAVIHWWWASYSNMERKHANISCQKLIFRCKHYQVIHLSLNVTCIIAPCRNSLLKINWCQTFLRKYTGIYWDIFGWELYEQTWQRHTHQLIKSHRAIYQ